ncbi:MAG: phage major capsid protein [Kiritimatiellia bacterium]
MDPKTNPEQTRQKKREAILTVREVGEGDAKKKEVSVSVSSEEPCLGWVYDSDAETWVRALEILGHGDGEIDKTRIADGLVIQDGHYGRQVGIIDKPEVSDSKLGGVVRFGHSQEARDLEADALDGIRKNMSVGYFVREWKKVKDGDKKTGKLPVYRAVKWCPYEASFVNVPADVRVGVGREMDITEGEPAATTAAKKERSLPMAEPANTPAVTPAATPTPAADLAGEIRAIKGEITMIREELKKPTVPAEQRGVVLDPKDEQKIAREYDLMKVIRSLAGERGADAGFEREVSDEIAKQTKRNARGFFIPEQVMARAFNVGTEAGKAGKNLVSTDTLFAEMVPALVAETVLGKLGARIITGLVGDADIPKADAATAYWVAAEGGDAKETTPNIGQVKLSPHTVGAYTDITRRLMFQSGIGVQAFISQALRDAIAVAIETAAFSGDGTGGAPKGLDSTTGVNAITAATAPTLAKILEFITAIEEANAHGVSMKFAGKPSVWAKLGSTLDVREISSGGASATTVGAVNGGYLLDTKSSMCQGYDFVKANLATAKKLYFGDWSKMVLAFWSGLDLTVDTASLSKSGGVRLVALQDMDVAITQPKAFSVGQVIA